MVVVVLVLVYRFKPFTTEVTQRLPFRVDHWTAGKRRNTVNDR